MPDPTSLILIMALISLFPSGIILLLALLFLREFKRLNASLCRFLDAKAHPLAQPEQRSESAPVSDARYMPRQ